jgi:O-antigen/teichoic acid export membrane protein
MSGDEILTVNWLSTTIVALRARSGKRVLKNVAALSISQVASYVLPLIVLPYTAAVLGPRYFGVVALTQAAVQYSTLITNYGFSLSATRQAALSQNDRRRLSEIVVHVWAAKCVLMLGCLAGSTGVFLFLPSLRPHVGPYLCGFLTVLGNVLYLDWFFQAVEEMKWITVITVTPRLLLTPLIFVFVKAPSDYIWLILIQSATFLISGMLGAALVRYRLGLQLPLPTVAGVSGQLRDGWQTFLANVSVNLYTSSNIVVLGMLSNVTTVGYYSAGQRIVGALQSLWSPFNQSLYPHFCNAFHQDKVRATRQLRTLAALVGSITACGATVACVLAPWVVPLYLGPRFLHSVGVIQILVFSIFFVTLNNVFGFDGLLALGLYNAFRRVVSVAAILSLLLAVSGITLFGTLGLAGAYVLVEAFVCGSQYGVLRRTIQF